MDMNNATVLQVLLTRVADGYEAHCLPMDIVTEARTIEEAISDVCDLISAQYRYARDMGSLEDAFVPAPIEYWQKLAHARVLGTREVDVNAPSEHCHNHTTGALCVQELELVGADA